jgi:hypothetical protein
VTVTLAFASSGVITGAIGVASFNGTFALASVLHYVAPNGDPKEVIATKTGNQWLLNETPTGISIDCFIWCYHWRHRRRFF